MAAFFIAFLPVARDVDALVFIAAFISTVFIAGFITPPLALPAERRSFPYIRLVRRITAASRAFFHAFFFKACFTACAQTLMFTAGARKRGGKEPRVM